MQRPRMDIIHNMQYVLVKLNQIPFPRDETWEELIWSDELSISPSVNSLFCVQDYHTKLCLSCLVLSHTPRLHWLHTKHIVTALDAQIT